MVDRKQRTRRDRESLLGHCGQLGEDDFVDPTELLRSNRPRRATGKKVRQLCSQVARTLELILCDCADPVIEELSVVAVSPAPDSSRLLVVIATEQTNRDLILESLYQQVPRLRSEIARSIHRKRVPSLSFSIMPSKHEGGQNDD